LLARFLSGVKGYGIPALLVALVAIILTVKPNWISPSVRRVDFTTTSVQRAVTLNDYINEVNVAQSLQTLHLTDSDVLKVEAGNTSGSVVDFTVEMSGFKDDEVLPLRWTLMGVTGSSVLQSEDADPISRAMAMNNEGVPGINAELRGADVTSWSAWIDTSNVPPGKYYVRLELFDAEGVTGWPWLRPVKWWTLSNAILAPHAI
jgi:hypothetical protein